MIWRRRCNIDRVLAMTNMRGSFILLSLFLFFPIVASAQWSYNGSACVSAAQACQFAADDNAGGIVVVVDAPRCVVGEPSFTRMLSPCEIPQPSCAPGPYGGSYNVTATLANQRGQSFGSSVNYCVGGCQVTGTLDYGLIIDGGEMRLSTGDGDRYTGATCTEPDEPEPTEPVESQCPAGQVQFGNECLPAVEPGQCKDGETDYSLPGGMNICIPGTGTEVCEEGYSESEVVPGLCIPDEEDEDESRCQDGEVEWGYGMCFPAPDDADNCPEGTKLATAGERKACIPGTDGPDDQGMGQCPSGYIKQGSDCIGKQNGGSCPGGYESQTVGDQTYCVGRPGGGAGEGDGDGSFGGTCETGFRCDGDAAMCATAMEVHRQGCGTVSGEGSCEAPVQCDGDAIQCAVLRQNQMLMCAIAADSEESQLYGEEAGKEGDVTGDLEGSETVDLGGAGGGGGISRDPIISGSCIADFDVNVLGKSLTIEISRICPYLELLGNILLVITGLICYRIISRG